MPQSFIDKLIIQIKAHTPIIKINTSDPIYIKSEIQRAANLTEREAYFWNRADYMTKPKSHILNIDAPAANLLSLYSKLGRANTSMKETIEIFKEINKHPQVPEVKIDEPGDESDIHTLEWFSTTRKRYFILAMEDIDYGIPGIQPNKEIISMLRHILHSLPSDRTLIIVQNDYDIPKELEREIAVINCEYPDRESLVKEYLKTLDEFGIKSDGNIPEKIIDSVTGLTITEAKRAFSIALAKTGQLTESEIPILQEEKRTLIQKTGLLSFVSFQSSIENLGGLEKLKEWLLERKEIYSPEALAFGVQKPKGILLIGPPGTGKSLAAKTIANLWKWPLIHLDLGKIFDQWVGNSEKNMRKALASVDVLSPCVLWIDEIEKGIGINDNSDSVHGTTVRVFGTLVTWMQERTSPVFIVATANNVSHLSPELLRKGRFDEIFFLDLPGVNDRKDILRIHLEKRGHCVFSEDEMNEIALLSKGFSGAELENAVECALIKAFSRDKVLVSDDLKNAVKSTTPLSVRRFYEIKGIRDVGKSCGVSANSEASDADGMEFNGRDGNGFIDMGYR